MIKNIIVTGKSKVNEISHELKVPHVLISIQGSTSNKMDRRPYLHPSVFRKAVLWLNFDDIDNYEEGFKTISEEDAKRIIEFVEKYKDRDQVEVILINCFAGISRSSAVAAAINYLYKINTYTDYFRDNRYFPNRLVYSTILRVYYNQFKDKLPSEK